MEEDGYILQNEDLPCWICKEDIGDSSIYNRDIYDIFKKLTSIESVPDNRGEDKICLKCINMFKEYFKFRTTVRNAFKELLKESEDLDNCSAMEIQENFDQDSSSNFVVQQYKPEFNDDGKVQCPICASLFTQVSSLKQHMLKHTGLRPFVCEFCEKTFTRRTCLINHRRLHTGIRPYQCDQCVLTFTTKDRKDRHIQRDHKENYSKKIKRKNSCALCKKEHVSYLQLQLHMYQEHNEYLKKNKVLMKSDYGFNMNGTMEPLNAKPANYCDACYQVFPSKRELLVHQEGHMISKVYKCSVCKKGFGKKSGLMYHHLRSHTNDIKNEVIDSDESHDLSTDEEERPLKERIKEMRFLKCAQSIDKTKVNFVAVTILKSFKCRGPREKTMDEHQCPICKKSFTTGPSLKVHLRSHTGDKPFSCKICLKSFTRKNVLNVHLRKHTGERPYKCNYCKLAFPTKYALDCHLENIHEANDIKFDFGCLWCNKVFPDDAELKNHMLNHDKIGDESFKCNLCGLIFLDANEMKLHFLTHNKPLFNQCGICSKTYKEKFKLESHLKSHKGNTFKCLKCEKIFVLKDDLVLHIKTDHVNPKNRRYSCIYCGELFFSLIILKDHLLHKHNDDEFYNKCEECGQSFRTTISFSKHIYKVHDQVHQICYEENCNKQFSSQKSFDIHILKHFSN